eukprot:PhF_6_TR41594/c0_g1_i1/m.63030/K18693/DPP1, DPPL, PLPP4_5; diacylglycerol diphosphate phosphatase / phosphatidate phosphatase
MEYLRAKLTFFYEKGYVWDWVCLAILVAIAEGASVPVTVFCQQFHWGDPTIGYTYVPSDQQTVPMWLLFILIIVIPVVVMIGVVMLQCQAGTRGSQLYWGILLLAQSLILQLVVVEPLKIQAGRLRPDFLDRLRIFANVTESSKMTWDQTCSLSETYSDIREGRLSFPSGHSSTSFASMTCLSMFLMHHINNFNAIAPWGRLPMVMVCLSPLTIAVFVAISRTRDHWHNYSDILAGACIGVAAAVLAFKINFTWRNSSFVLRMKTSPHSPTEPSEYV